MEKLFYSRLKLDMDITVYTFLLNYFLFLFSMKHSWLPPICERQQLIIDFYINFSTCTKWWIDDWRSVCIIISHKDDDNDSFMMWRHYSKRILISIYMLSSSRNRVARSKSWKSEFLVWNSENFGIYFSKFGKNSEINCLLVANWFRITRNKGEKSRRLYPYFSAPLRICNSTYFCTSEVQKSRLFPLDVYQIWQLKSNVLSNDYDRTKMA